MMKRFVLSILASLALVLSVQAAIEVYEFDNTQQEQQFKDLSNTLRCPKCQNNTIGDSNAALAQDLRHKVYEMTKQGKSEQEIVDYMIARYGNFVTYNPPFTVATSILWLGPLAVVVFGFGFIVLRTRRSKASVTEQAENWDAQKEARLKQLLENEALDEKNGDKQ
ncbi:Cytochrome c-type biogenesis protein CcmH [Vibrio aestuarianus]|uniref:Cytochrome c-type biogenesis protein n=2 Tax=Vibrio aestuarianus TaxID=28171 RepID=A0ABM9FNM6_9VIBR|nr:Cytochrome c-type biogenesis protein CcmH [Vibrio aestuarianus]CAH8188498.1 Cytochrome c-type biogenesis protein CcmH [Vibrio aestuarianus]CAH8188618.1 Cytochrome c-type biogenesis protein CcmH [Vibrio aestuarianus]CAH8188772.1 Cytochrome c-type biogenesis protein CcmH [Vibrio aestuarianus]CAH8188962.1 Cytochrome c-type biogenesis protein CcmH [Vibrio aestuarianus]